MPKKLLTLDDLYDYFDKTNKSMTFNSSDSDEEIVVQVGGTLSFSDNYDSKEGLTPVKLQACHIDQNLNRSFISEETMTQALSSFANRPILGFIHTVDGEPQFYGHQFHIDEDGSMVYDEIPVGIIPSDNDGKLVYDEEKQKTYVNIKGYIFDEYTKATEILEREKKCACSVEMNIKSMEFDAVKKLLVITGFYFSGVTILGVTPEGDEVKPGMAGANIKLADFAESQNSLFSNNLLIDSLDKLNDTLSRFNIKDSQEKSKKGGSSVNLIEELLTKYNKKIEDITFDYSDMTNEELEAKFVELFGNHADNGEEGAASSSEGEVKFENAETHDANNDSMTISFEISHEDIRYALYNLLAPYEEADGEYYYISNVYDSHFTYENSNKVFGQKYHTEGDDVVLDGERYELFVEYLTASEKAELEQMRSNYSSVVKELETYKLAAEEVEKEKVLGSNEYELIRDTEEFKNIVKESKEFSLDDVKEKCDKALLDFVKAGGKFQAHESKKEKKLSVAFGTHTQEVSFLDTLLKKK